jgi:ribonuclease BN (tRNA processing enzyme)
MSELQAMTVVERYNGRRMKLQSATNSRTPLVVAIALMCPTLAIAAATPEPAKGTTVTLLGTAGGPGGAATRAGIASLVTVQSKHYLIDAGEGVSHQLAAAGLMERDLSAIFLTHLHEDHTAGLPALMSFFYVKRGSRLPLIGPPGAQSLLQGVLAYMQPSVDIRKRSDPATVPPSAVFFAQEVQPGLIFADGLVKVTAVENTHYRLSTTSSDSHPKSYSLRFVTPDKVIVFTGDTGESAAVESLAQDADILVSEMVTATDTADVPPEVRAHMSAEHLSPAQVGQLAAKARVKALVLSHIRTVSDTDVAEIRRHYSGPIAVGHDLARF